MEPMTYYYISLPLAVPAAQNTYITGNGFHRGMKGAEPNMTGAAFSSDCG